MAVARRRYQGPTPRPYPSAWSWSRGSRTPCRAEHQRAAEHHDGHQIGSMAHVTVLTTLDPHGSPTEYGQQRRCCAVRAKACRGVHSPPCTRGTGNAVSSEYYARRTTRVPSPSFDANLLPGEVTGSFESGETGRRAGLLHRPSSQRYSVPDWQRAEPGEYELPLDVQLLAVTSGRSAQAIPDPFHCPSSHRYSLPDWQTTDWCEYLVSLYWQPSSPSGEPNA